MEEAMDVKSYIDETVEFNRHVAGILLIKAEGGDATDEELAPISCNVSPLPDAEVVAALNRSFFEGERQDPEGIPVASHRLHVTERLEIREIAVVVLQENVPNPVHTLGTENGETTAAADPTNATDAAAETAAAAANTDEKERAEVKAAPLSAEGGENEQGIAEGGVKPSDFIRGDYLKEKVTVETLATSFGAVLSTSRKWVLVATFEPGMNIDFTKQVAAGLAEFLAGEGE